MKRFPLIAIGILIALWWTHHAARDAYALDAPHNTNDQAWSITCTRCHYSPSGALPPWASLPTTTDNTFKNNLCKDCHSPSGMPLADPLYTNVKTHSAGETGSSYWGGNWTVECITCHSPHYQQQSTNASYSAEAGVNVITGTVSSIASTYGAVSSTLTDSSAVFPVNGYIGYLLVPNINYPTRVYRINANDATTFTVDGSINLNYAVAGATYALRYGKMINASIQTPNSGVQQVKFFNQTGPNSFGSGVNAVCQVCHTLTMSFRNDGTQEAGNHPPGVAETQPCTDCHAHADGFKKGGCTECHGYPPVDNGTLVFADKAGTPVTSDSPGAGAHLKHVTTANLVCENCHTGGMLSGAYAGDNQINIGFRAGGVNLGGNYDGKSGRSVYPYAGGGSTTVSTGNSLQCSSVYCHSTGQSLDGTSATPVYASPPPAWTTPASGACGTCHGTTAATLTTGRHAVHLNAAGVNGCGDCHDGAANDASSYVSKNHANRSIDVLNGYTMGGAPGNGYGTCSTAVCHQTGITAGDYVVTPVWNVDAPNCTVCHANVPATGAHGVHVTSIGYDCSQCHTNAVKDTSYASTQHLDQNIDVAVGGYPANKAIGSAKQNCTSTCHGSRSPVWDDLSGTEGNCSICHGMAADPSDARDTNGDTAATDKQVGAHYAHLTAMSVYSAPISCTDCHTVPAGATYADKVKAAGHIDGDNQAELVFSGLATTNGASPSYDYGTGTCSNVYCHGAKMINLSTNGTDTRPEWTQVAYLTSSPSKTGDCGTCHGAPPNTGSHSGSEPLSACTGCHSHVNASGSFNNKVLHIDGMVQATGCTGCHGQPPIDAATMVASPPATADTGRKTLFPSSSGGAGAHDLHVNSKSIGCNRCHNSGGDNGHQTRLQITFGFTYGLNGGLYQAPTFSNGFSLRSDGTTTVQITGSVRQCSSIYCHSSGQAADGQPGDPVFATPNWDDPASAACGACHKTTTGTLLGRMDTGSHTKHLDASAVCGDCHTGAGTGVAGSPDYTDNANHLNQLIDVASGLSYTGSGVPGNGYATCTTASCHDNGRGVSVPSPQWGSSVAACTACHALQPATGSHQKHLVLTQYAKPVCGDCHDGAVQGTTAPVTHLTGSVEVYDATPGDLGYPTVARHNDANFQSCTTAYCHSTGQSLVSGTSATPVYSSVTWSTTITCGGCHAATKAAVIAANSGSHATHLNAAAVSGCDACHTGAASDGSSYNSTNHVNRSIDVASGLSYTGGGAPGNGYGTCSTAYCHSNGKGTYASPLWGSTSPGCTFCHPTLSGKHASHVVFTNASVYGSVSTNETGTTASYDFGCGNCHPTNVANHMNGSVELSLNPADGGTLKSQNSATASVSGSGLTTQCSGVYCHSNGKASPAFVQTPQWQNAFPNSWNTCGNCHGNSPAGSNHGAHVVGVHYDGIYSGGVGLASAGTGTGNSHGNAAYSTTLNCNVCHSGTVTKSRNKYGAACASCHSGDADNATNAMVSADLTKTVHVNGQPDVQFAAIQVRSRAQVRDDITTVAELNTNWTRPAGSYKTGATPYDTAVNALNTATMWTGGSKTCSNIACHNGNSVSWSDTVSCSSCHTQLP